MVISIEVLLQLTAVLIFILWQFYWIISEREADREKPKGQTNGHYRALRKAGFRVIYGVLLLQLLGFSLLPIDAPPAVLFILQITGFIFVLIGISISVSARKTLGTNWAHAFEYQVKQEQELVTSGIYKYIRHPIYTGLMLAMIGGELLAQSYLVIAMLAVQAIVGYKQAKSEEKLLLAHFGAAYKHYMKRTKMFIPYLW